MITIIPGTNRPGNKSRLFADLYLEAYLASGVDAQMFDLQKLPPDFSSTWMSDRQSTVFQDQVVTYFRNADKFHLVVPEYQGTFPGILKLVLDAVPPREIKGKKIALTGIGAGRGGNLRGMDHLAAGLHYLGLSVYPVLLPVSKIADLITPEGVIHDKTTIDQIRSHAGGFSAF